MKKFERRKEDNKELKIALYSSIIVYLIMLVILLQAGTNALQIVIILLITIDIYFLERKSSKKECYSIEEYEDFILITKETGEEIAFSKGFKIRRKSKYQILVTEGYNKATLPWSMELMKFLKKIQN